MGSSVTLPPAPLDGMIRMDLVHLMKKLEIAAAEA